MNIETFLQIEPLVTNGMSTFQMDKFVVNESITPFRKLRQALIEARGRLEGVTSINFDLEETALKQKKAVLERDALEGIDKELKDIDVRRLEFELNRKKTQKIQIEREAEFFLGQIDAIVNNELGGVETAVALLKDTQYHNEQEEQYWVKRLARGVYSDFLNYGTISKGLTESLACLTNDQQQQILSEAMQQQETFRLLMDQTRDQLLVEKD